MAQAARHLDNQIIASVMAPGIVNDFEAIQIQQQQRHALVVTGRGGQCLSQPIFNQRPVRQPGQHIVKRQMLRLRLAGPELQQRLR